MVKTPPSQGGVTGSIPVRAIMMDKSVFNNNLYCVYVVRRGKNKLPINYDWQLVFIFNILQIEANADRFALPSMKKFMGP